MTTFLALYRGRTISDAKVIAVTADADLVAHVASQLLASVKEARPPSSDPIVLAIDTGREQALRLIADGDDE